MARILFVENREKTAFWEQVALGLRRKGFEIGWLVQNLEFRPKEFDGDSKVHVLPYPSRSTKDSLSDEAISEQFPSVITDRGRTYFGAGTGHYEHYAREIEGVLKSERPDWVVGESTLFHELIVIDKCRSLGIQFVHPCANRYPSGRFSIYDFDTQIPVAWSGENWPVEKARGYSQQIAAGNEIPFYMQVPSRAERMFRKAKWAWTRGRVLRARLRGECYNTPSLIKKWRLERGVAKNLDRWRNSARMPSNPSRTILYPMQLQPEANIDVWGRPYSDQVAFIKDLLQNAPVDVQVAIKANPKAKYEVSVELLNFAEAEPRIVLLPLGLSMNDAQANSLGTVTVSGTVGFEAVMGKGRCISLRHPLINEMFPSLHADTPTEAVDRLLRDPHAGLGGGTMGEDLIQALVRTSFSGLISDPLSKPCCLAPDNIDAVVNALDFSSRQFLMKSRGVEVQENATTHDKV